MLVWACERLDLYVCGQPFELETDHKPLEHIYSATSKPCVRIERCGLHLQSYNFKVVYHLGKADIMDALSRLNSDKRLVAGEEFDYVRVIVENCVLVALLAKEIERASFDDEELSMVKSCVRSENWSQCKAPVSYFHVKDDLCIYREVLLRGMRIVIPNALRNQGIVKTKTRLRSKVWWPKMDSDTEKLCKTWLPGGGRVWGPRADVTCCAPYCSLARYQRRPVRTTSYEVKYLSGSGLFQQILGGRRLEVHNKCKDN